MNRSAAVFLPNVSPCLVKVSADGCHILVSLTPRRTFNFTRNSDSFMIGTPTTLCVGVNVLASLV